jgi:competence protein ComEC
LLSRVASEFEYELTAGRGFLWLPVMFAVGIVVYFSLPGEPSLWLLLPASPLCAAGAYMLRHQTGAFRFLVILSVLTAGTTVAKIRTDLVSAPMIQRERTVALTGWIAWIEEGRQSGFRVRLKLNSVAEISASSAPEKVQITLRTGGDGLTIGDAISVRARLIPPSGPLIPGGFDYSRRSYYLGIGAVGFAYGAPERVDIGPAPWRLRVMRPVARLREIIRLRVESALPGDAGEIAAALITGDRGGISGDTQDAMRASGLGHILAISGLHMALVAGTAFWLIRALLALSPTLALRYPIKKWAAAAALTVAVLYLAISGANIATQRAFIMMMIMLVAIMIDRRAITLRNVALAAFAILILSPENLFSASFQMSFAATAALVSAYEALNMWRDGRVLNRPTPRLIDRFQRTVSGMVFTSLIAGLATMPFALFHFQRIAPLSLIANLAAMPAVGILIMPMALLAVAVMALGLEIVPLTVMGWGLEWVMQVATKVAGWSGEVGLLPSVQISALAVFGVGFLWLVLWQRPWRLAGVALMVLAGFMASAPERPQILIDEDATAVAVRGDDGRYRILRKGRAGFEVGAWLRSDGDGRSVTDDSLDADVSCDDLGCATRTGAAGLLVALSFDDIALAEDCRMADVVITRNEVPKGCTAGAIVVDETDLKRFGAHAIYWPEGEITGAPRITTAYPRNRRPFMPQRRR